MKKGRKLFKRVLDELAQQTKKTVYGEKTVEASMPGLCRKAAAEGGCFIKEPGKYPPLAGKGPLWPSLGGSSWTGFTWGTVPGAT